MDDWNRIVPLLEGSIVILEPLDLDHEDGLFEAASHPEIWKWFYINPIESRESFHRSLVSMVEESQLSREAAFTVFDVGSGTPIGSTSYLELKPEHRRLEIGSTWLTPSAWRTGANIEAKLLLLGYAFESLGCIRVEFKTDARNDQSRAALEALPARYEGTFRKHMVVRDGDLRDSAWYSIIDDEWPEVKTNLTERLLSHVE